MYVHVLFYLLNSLSLFASLLNNLNDTGALMEDPLLIIWII